MDFTERVEEAKNSELHFQQKRYSEFMIRTAHNIAGEFVYGALQRGKDGYRTFWKEYAVYDYSSIYYGKRIRVFRNDLETTISRKLNDEGILGISVQTSESYAPARPNDATIIVTISGHW